MKKIYKRDKGGLIERFLTANLTGLEEDELVFQKEFNAQQMHMFTIIYQNNPVRLDADTFEKEGTWMEYEYLGNLNRIFCCNNIDKFIENLDRVEESMKENKSEEISEIVENIKELKIPSVLDSKKEE